MWSDFPKITQQSRGKAEIHTHVSEAKFESRDSWGWCCPWETDAKLRLRKGHRVERGLAVSWGDCRLEASSLIPHS